MFLKYNLPAFIWGLVILMLTLMPGKFVPPLNMWDLSLDKLAHLGVFMILAVLQMAGFLKQYSFQWIRYRAVWVVVLGCSVYGILLEVMQEYLLSDRYFDVYDALFNVVGCVLGIFVFKFVLYKVTF